jgi:hypothetical protein
MTTILTPLDFSGTETLSRRLFRKRVLPVDSIQYQGRQIDFTRDYLNKMVNAFNEGAYDNVPLQFADASNNHTNDPDRYRGDVVAMSLEDDGLYVTVSATPEGAKVLEANNKLGISARIITEYDRADGKHYPAAIQHVLATHDPRIPGLGPWSTVENLSNDDESDIIDLTAETFAVAKKKSKERPVPKKDENGLSDTELTRLREILAEFDAEDTEADEPVDETPSDELTDDELATLLEALNSDEDLAPEVETVDEPELADASLSNAETAALELANQRLAAATAKLDEANWKAERVTFMKEYGLSPKIVDLAAPLLKGEHVIELSNGENLDANKVMRDVLTEVSKLAKLLDLSNELGSSVDAEPDTSDEASSRRDETTKAVRAMMGN